VTNSHFLSLVLAEHVVTRGLRHRFTPSLGGLHVAVRTPSEGHEYRTKKEQKLFGKIPQMENSAGQTREYSQT
jgi:hypothetical protein